MLYLADCSMRARVRQSASTPAALLKGSRMSPKRQSRPQRRYDRLAVLDVVDTFQQTHRRSPSQREIVRALQMSAPSVAHNAIHALIRQGLLSSTPTRRGLTANLHLTPTGHQRLAEWRASRGTTPPASAPADPAATQPAPPDPPEEHRS